MDLLTKYRPVRSLEFYQRKVLRFCYSSEGTDDLRNLAIPYGILGFDSPLHFIRCIPQDLCDEYAQDKLFQRVDKGLRKGYRVFLTSDDGKIQSGIYKGQKFSPKSNEWEAIVDGHKKTYPLDNVVPYKEFLRKSVGAMLIEGPNKVTGTIVQYEEPKWEVGDAIFYKPSKRWAIIEERDLYTNGKVYCKIRIEKTKVKREKVVRVPLWQLMASDVSTPYRQPIIPKNNANYSEYISNLNASTNKNDLNSESSTFPKEPEKVIRQFSNESEKGKKTPKVLLKSISMDSSHSASITSPSPRPLLSQSSDNCLIELQNSPKSPRPKFQNDYTEAPTVTYRQKKSRMPSMRPLTEFFHSKSEDVPDDSNQPLEGNKFISVSNLTTEVFSDDEGGEFTLENYTNSLRRSARNVLAKQLAQEAFNRQGLHSSKKKVSKSIDGLDAINKQHHPSFADHKSIPAQLNTRHQQTPSSSITNDTSGSDSPPPPLPASMPPPLVPSVLNERPVYSRQPSVVEKYFIEPAPRNYENSNYHRQHGSFSASSELSNSLQEDGNFSLSDITDSLAQDDNPTNHFQYNSSAPIIYNQTLHHSVSVPVFDPKPEFFTTKHIDMQEGHYSSSNGQFGSSTLEKQKSSRYRKNPSATVKSNRGEHFHKVKSVPNMMEHSSEPVHILVPPPFSSDNIYSAVGKGRGIQAGYHSCYADVSLFSLFYCTNIFDKILLSDNELDKGMKKDIKIILKHKIVKPLRLSAFCSRESVSQLRLAMLPLSSKLNSSFMDAEEFLYLMFENALQLSEFIKYSNGTNDFMHQIIVKPKDRSRCHDIQFLFGTSLEINDLKIAQVPMPALMICMPRCNGRLVYYEAIIPNLSLNITKFIDNGPKKCLCEMAASLECASCYKRYGDVALAYCETCQRMAEQIHYHIGHNPVLIPKPQKNITLSLLAVICIRNNHYTTFVKTSPDRLAPWLFFEATPTENPEVVLLDDFGRWLDKLEREPERYREFAKSNPFLKRIITESHICIYYSPEANNSTNQFAESFMI